MLIEKRHRMAFILEGVPDVHKEDSGMFLQAELIDYSEPEIFIRIMSWDDTGEHKDLHQLLNSSKLRVTIETIE